MTDVTVSRTAWNDLAIASVRYAIGRRTGIVATVAECVGARARYLDADTRSAIIREINEAEDRDDLGDDGIDAPYWLRLREVLSA